MSFPDGSAVKNPPAMQEIWVRHTGSTPGLGRFPGEGNGNLLQYSYVRNSMDRGAWQTAVHEFRISFNEEDETGAYFPE